MPSGLAIFAFRKNGVLVTETAVPASPLIEGGRIYAEIQGAVLIAVGSQTTIVNRRDEP